MFVRIVCLTATPLYRAGICSVGSQCDPSMFGILLLTRRHGSLRPTQHLGRQRPLLCDHPWLGPYELKLLRVRARAGLTEPSQLPVQKQKRCRSCSFHMESLSHLLLPALTNSLLKESVLPPWSGRRWRYRRRFSRLLCTCPPRPSQSLARRCKRTKLPSLLIGSHACRHLLKLKVRSRLRASHRHHQLRRQLLKNRHNERRGNRLHSWERKNFSWSIRFQSALWNCSVKSTQLPRRLCRVDCRCLRVLRVGSSRRRQILRHV
jgi:hypothetical protein